jgi:hypothetical protein
MIETVRHFRLANGPGSLGPSWGDAGLALAGVSLFRRTDDGFAPRPVGELEALLGAAYERRLDASLVRGLGVAADALNHGDIGRAMIAALHLRLPDLTWEGASRIAKVDERLAKYSPDQPRDWHGRWTSEAGESAPDCEADPTPSTTSPAPSADRAAPPKPNNISSAGDDTNTLGGPTHMSGGVLIPVQNLEGADVEREEEPARGIGDNSSRADPPIDPVLGREKVPEGWDQPPKIVDGHYVPAVRFPVLPRGTPWPQPTIHLVQTILASQPGKKPVLPLFVPRDGIGPTLLGADLKGDYPQPSGYDLVKLFGTPQITRSGGIETGHARDSIEVALKRAATNRYSAIYFNSAISTVTGGAQEVAFRPDVVAVVRPELSVEPTFVPYEIYSPRQDPKYREGQLKDIPGFYGLDGHFYKYIFENGRLFIRYVGPAT